MRPTLRQLEYFTTVAELGSFRRAAERLAVTQPSLSKQINTLEEELGLRLFERTSRQVKLSRPGQELLEEARAVLAAAYGFKTRARELSQRPAYHLNAGVLPSIGAYFMPRLTRRLSAVFPDLQISFIEGPSSDLLRRLETGEVDCVMASRGPQADFSVKPVFDETLWVCTRADDPLMQARGSLPLEALRGRRILTLSPDFHLTQIVEDLALKAGAQLSAQYRGASLDAIRQIASQSDAVAVLPSLYALGEAIRDPAFRVRHLDDPDAVHPVRLYWRRETHDRAFFERLAEEIIAEKALIRAERAPEFQIPPPGSVQQPVGVQAVHMAHKRRMDLIAQK